MQRRTGKEPRSAQARNIHSQEAFTFHRGRSRSTHARFVSLHSRRRVRPPPLPLKRPHRQHRRRLYRTRSSADEIGPSCAGSRCTYGRRTTGRQGDASSWVLVSLLVARSVVSSVSQASRQAQRHPSQLLNVQVPLFFKEIIDTLNIPLDAQSTVWVVCGSVILACMPQLLPSAWIAELDCER
jgi:hypothetical protein